MDSLGISDAISIAVTRASQTFSSTTTTVTTLSFMDYLLGYIIIGSFIMFLCFSAWKVRRKILYEK
jgi:hypothetical protein